MPSSPYQTSVSIGASPEVYLVTIPVFAMTSLGNVDELIDYIPGYNFEIVGLDFVVVTPVTTSAKTATFTPTIDAVAVPGCTLVVAGTKAKGVVTYGSAPTGRIYGSATSKIKITGSAVTAFAEGAGYFVLKIRNVGNLA